jgi:hypothetical protein
VKFRKKTEKKLENSAVRRRTELEKVRKRKFLSVEDAIFFELSVSWGGVHKLVEIGPSLGRSFPV